MIEARAFARAGLLGNPSDGYFGKTISVIVKNFGANILLYEAPELIIEDLDVDKNSFRSIHHLIDSVQQNGYYGGTRLVKAAIKKFGEYCIKEGIKIDNKNFRIRYRTSIPRQVGMAGSSAIVTATMKALMKFYNVEIPNHILPTLVLSAEVDELGINAGLQDRVIQAYEGCVYMNFDKEHMDKHNFGIYKPINLNKLPKLYVAYKTKLSKVSGAVLNNIRERYDSGDSQTIETLKEIGELAESGKTALENGDFEQLHSLINQNFDLRCKIMNVSESNKEMVNIARHCGASAKFSGSGGTIIGTYNDDDMLRRLIVNLKKIDARVIKPILS